METDQPRVGYAKGRERRAAILRVAGDQFAAQGYRGASLAQIAQGAGISDAGLLHHFPSKEHLLLEVLRQRDEHDRRRIDESSDPSFLATMIRLCEANAKAPGLVQLFTLMAAESIDPGHPGHEMFRERYRRIRGAGARNIRAAQARGEIRADLDPDRLTIQLLALFDGLQLQWLLEPDEVDMVEVLRDFLARIEPEPAER